MQPSVEEADVVIVGAGVVGCAIARELSRYDLEIVLLERESDVGSGASKANSAIIHTGFDAHPGTLESQLVVRANWLFDGLAQELEVPFKRVGALLVAVSPEEEEQLSQLKATGEANGVHDLKIMGRDELLAWEPAVNPHARGALWIPRESLTCPFTLTVAYAENAIANGVKLYLETEVEELSIASGQVRGVRTSRGTIQCNWVINAGGLYSDRLAQQAGLADFRVTPRKGEFWVLDKAMRPVQHIILPVPTPISKGILVTPTIDGNTLMGPTADNIEDKGERATTAAGLARVLAGARKLVPGIHPSQSIVQFAGVRAAGNAPDYLVGPVVGLKGFINACNIRSTGVTSSPAVARLVAEVLAQEGVEFKPKADYNPHRPCIPRFSELSWPEQATLIAKNPAYGRIVCRCETVTEAEVVAALHRNPPARTLDGIKRRTRAGMGRCQGGFCTPRVVQIMARELGLDPTALTKKGPGSELFAGTTKQLLAEQPKAEVAGQGANSNDGRPQAAKLASKEVG